MATRRPSDERPSSEERRARARAERRIVMPSNRVSRPKGTVRSSSSATAQSSSARPSSSASRPSARAATRPKSSSKAVTPHSGGAAAGATAKRAGGATTARRAASPSNRSRATVSQAKAPRNFCAPRGASAGRAGIASRPAAKRRSLGPRIALAAVLALLALVGGAWAIDGAVNGSRIYDGVSVGAVDVSGMTEEEARRAVSSFYEPRVADGRALIFASEEARDTLDVESELAEQDAQAEQLSLEEARANKQVWVAESGTLGARLSVSELVSAPSPWAETAVLRAYGGGAQRRFRRRRPFLRRGGLGGAVLLHR
ncbi:MAG: hypothetical protein ACLSDQ_12485 [Adlercreutzia equolifaciens]